MFPWATNAGGAQIFSLVLSQAAVCQTATVDNWRLSGRSTRGYMRVGRSRAPSRSDAYYRVSWHTHSHWGCCQYEGYHRHGTSRTLTKRKRTSFRIR
ncbi:hypothetical protein EDB87DRAFT_1616110 [Lactarius vividus]|nr:hypothetical protein EDB87DRAFT_1616110 [Lactarius vividus]